MKKYLIGAILLPFVFVLAQAQTNQTSAQTPAKSSTQPSAQPPAGDKVYAPLLDFESANALQLPAEGSASNLDGTFYAIATAVKYNTDPANLAPGSKQSLQAHSYLDYNRSSTGLTDAQIVFKGLSGKLAVDGFKFWAKFPSTQGAAPKLTLKVGGEGDSLKTFEAILTVPDGGGWIEVAAKDIVSIDWSKPDQPKTLMSDLSKADLTAYSTIDFAYEHKGKDQVFYLDKIQTYTNAPPAPAAK